MNVTITMNLRRQICRALLVLVTLLSANAAAAKKDFDVNQELNYCSQQVRRALAQLRKAGGTYDFSLIPRNILATDSQPGWNCRKAKAEEWCSGFWPGILWMDYAVTGDSEVRRAAEGYTEALHDIAYQPVFDHDIGFLMFCSYGKGYEVNHDEAYKRVLLASADTLATLFNPLVGTLLSWPRNVKLFGGHNTIMDNMMNLDLLFWAAHHGGNPLLGDMAVAHATTTMRHQFRPDGSCYHVAVYDTLDGHFLHGVTHQGYSDESMWARGQAWAIYGYTLVYRWTRRPVFLRFARHVADAYIRALTPTPLRPGGKATTVPTTDLSRYDLVPKWDFCDPDPAAPKDASAACVVADALLELSQYAEGAHGAFYRHFAEETLRQLSTPAYQSGDKNVSFLLHSTGHHPAGSEIDASIVYADYYYLEALMRLKVLQQKEGTSR